MPEKSSSLTVPRFIFRVLAVLGLLFTFLSSCLLLSFLWVSADVCVEQVGVVLQEGSSCVFFTCMFFEGDVLHLWFFSCFRSWSRVLR